ncbi:MAG: phenylacetate--CoA ligase [Deltaproteobacteria bacterium RBG_13_60_28]|nr:MAG: phenylacetate--CoA ligase [Deltaproteobacteria bacterium RBG_13_60_28]
MEIFDQEAEQMERRDMAQVQLERLQATLHRVYKNVKFYKKKFDEVGFLPEDCRSLEDLARLPFTTRLDLAQSYPYEMFAVPLREVVRIHSSTGSPGAPIVMGYTARDLRNWAKLAARVLTAAGVDRDDVVQVTLSYGLLTSAFGIHSGVELLGASVIPTGPGSTVRQVQIMRDYRTTVLVSTPSYAQVLADRMEVMGVDPKNLHLKLALLAGEPWTEAQRREIESRLYLTALDHYALSEAMGPGVAGECEHRRGMHLHEDHFLPEIIDPKSGAPLAAGELGELVLTTITKEASPLVRFRTGDLCRLLYEPCPCGRTLARMSRIKGRTDEVVIVKGINIFPSRVGQILAAIQGEEPAYQLVIGREGHLDYLEVKIEVREGLFFDKMTKQREFLQQLTHKLAQGIGVQPRVKLVEPLSISREEETSPLVIDLRK